MKKFRLLAVMVITVAMLCTVAFAADVAFDAIEYNGTDDTVTVTVTATKDLNIGWFSALAVGYDGDVFEYVSATSDDAGAGFTDMGTSIVYSADAGDVTLASGKVIIAATFNVLDKAAVVGSEFSIDMNDTAFSDTSYADFDVEGVAVEVTGAQKAEAPTYTEVTDGEGVFQGVNDIYTGVWTGAYTVTLNGNAADKVKVDFDATHSYEVEADAAGEGAIAFKIAVVGAPKNAKAVPSVFGTEWVAAVKAE